MKILIINHYAGSPEMGMEFRPYYFAREWIKLGHRVHIIAADYSHLRKVNPEVKKDFQEDIIDNIHYHWIKTRRYEGNGVKRAFTMAQFISKLWIHSNKIINELSPDVVIASSTYPLDTFVGQRIRKKSKKKVKLIHEVHDMWPATLIEVGGMSKYNPFVVAMQIGENSAYKNSDYVVSLLPNAENYMLEHGLKKGRFKCIPNGIVLEEWSDSESIPKLHKDCFDKLKSEGKFIVGYFGGHALSNALDELLNIAREIDDSEIEFVLTGDGVEKDRLISKAKEEKIDNVLFLPSINKRSIPKLCEKLDCIIMCGHETPLYRFGLCLNKMFDAMASGKPSICALNVKSYFTDYNCGFDENIEDTEGICELIKNIKLMNEEEREIIEYAGKNAVRDRFNYKQLSKEFLDLMKETSYEKSSMNLKNI